MINTSYAHDRLYPHTHPHIDHSAGLEVFYTVAFWTIPIIFIVLMVYYKKKTRASNKNQTLE